MAILLSGVLEHVDTMGKCTYRSVMANAQVW